jgi:hypothetical protein
MEWSRSLGRPLHGLGQVRWVLERSLLWASRKRIHGTGGIDESHIRRKSRVGEGRGERNWSGNGLGFRSVGRGVVLADTATQVGEQVASTIRAEGASARFITADVSKPAEVESLVSEVVSVFGRLDVGFMSLRLAASQQPIANAGVRDAWRTSRLGRTTAPTSRYLRLDCNLTDDRSTWPLQ